MNKNYTAYHIHSDYSLLDSTTPFERYVDRAKELGMTAIGSTEHGKPNGWVHKKLYCESVGIKFIHGCEVYLTRSLEDTIRDNFHTILIAKNMDGVLELNTAVSRANRRDHTYYTGRMSFDEFLDLSDNIITTSACISSPLFRLSEDDPYYARLAQKYSYYEIQPHNFMEQQMFNRKLKALSREYGVPLIAATDTHCLDSYYADCRSIIMDAKGQHYDGEEQMDLRFQSYDMLVENFRQQNALDEETYMRAIRNTNVMADSVEDFAIDKAIKYPILYGNREEDDRVFKRTVWNGLDEKLKSGIIPKSQEEAFRSALQEEINVFEKLGMSAFMLSMSEIMRWCKSNDIAIGTARGSVGGSRVAYVTDIIDLNPETWHTVFSRFANESRVEAGDIDIDCVEEDRPRIFGYIINRFGSDKTARVESFGCLQEKSFIEDVCRGLNNRWIRSHPSEDKSHVPYSQETVDSLKAEWDFPVDSDTTDPKELRKLRLERGRKNHPEIYYYFDGMIGCRISQSVHPAGMIISPITLDDNYGTFEKDGERCLILDMEDAHAVGLVKYDMLVLKTVQVIRDTTRLLGVPYPRTHEIDWNDKNVWDDMITSPAMIFQMEGDYAFQCLRRFKPKNIFDMSLVTACIRPSGSSYREQLLDRKPHKNPSKLIDDLLRDNLGYVIYQCDTIKFLQQICGMSGSEADTIRRAIAHKQKDKLDAAMPSILEGYCRKSTKPRAVAEKEAKEFLKVIEDSASYQFGLNHSIAYCLLGYLCAYYRYYHPHEFISAFLNNAANEEDLKNATEFAQHKGVKIIPPKFGHSRAGYFYDEKTGCISKGIASVKYLNADIAESLFSASSESFDTFTDLILYLHKNTEIDIRQMKILIDLDYFSDYGISPFLNAVLNISKKYDYGEKTSIKKSSVSPDEERIMRETGCASDKGKTGNILSSFRFSDTAAFLKSCESELKKNVTIDLSFKEKAACQLENLGYVDLSSNNPEDRRKLYIVGVTPVHNKGNGKIWCYRLDTRSIGSGKSSRITLRASDYNMKPIHRGDILNAITVSKNKAGYWYLDEYEKIG